GAIGLACAQALVRSGARVAMLARTAGALTRAAEELGARALAIPCDVGDADAVAAAVSTVRERLDDEPDILVNNAGILVIARLEETTAETLAGVIGANLVAPFLLA